MAKAPSLGGIGFNGDKTAVCKEIYQQLTTKFGLSSAQALGILANVAIESDFDPTADEAEAGYGGTGYGILQWSDYSPDTWNRTKLVNWCAANPQYGAYTTLSGQLAFFYEQIQGNIAGSGWLVGRKYNNPQAFYNEFKTLTNPVDAAKYFRQFFEGPLCENGTYSNWQNPQYLSTWKFADAAYKVLNKIPDYITEIKGVLNIP